MKTTPSNQNSRVPKQIQVLRIQFRLSFSEKSSPFTAPLRAVSSVSRGASSDFYQPSPRVAVLSNALALLAYEVQLCHRFNEANIYMAAKPYLCQLCLLNY
jgi:hypothetical protein